jgi:hypothetical protein
MTENADNGGNMNKRRTHIIICSFLGNGENEQAKLQAFV